MKLFFTTGLGELVSFSQSADFMTEDTSEVPFELRLLAIVKELFHCFTLDRGVLLLYRF